MLPPNLLQASDLTQPLPFVIIGSFYDLFDRIGLYTFVIIMGTLLLVASFSYMLLKMLGGGSTRSLQPLFVRTIISLAILTSYGGARSGLYNLWLDSYNAMQGIQGEAYQNIITTVSSYGEDSIATVFGLQEVGDYVNGETLTGFAYVTAQVGRWFSKMNPTRFLGRGAEAIAREAFGVLGKVAFKNLDMAILGFVYIFYIPYFLSGITVLAGIVFLPVVAGLFVIGTTGTIWFSRWLSSMLSAYAIAIATPLIFVLAANIAILTPIVNFMNQVTDLAADVKTTFGVVTGDDETLANLSPEEIDQSVGSRVVGTLGNVILAPITILLSSMMLAIVGLTVSVILMFKYEAILGGYIGGFMGAGLAALGGGGSGTRWWDQKGAGNSPGKDGENGTNKGSGATNSSSGPSTSRGQDVGHANAPLTSPRDR